MAAATARERFANRTATRTEDVRTLQRRLRDLEAQVADYMDPDEKADIGARLKHARQNSPYGQRELADAAGVGLRTYQFWEQGRGVHRAGIEAVARKLGIDADDLWEGRDGDGGQLDRIEAALSELRAAVEANQAILLALDAWRAERQSSPETQPARRRRAS